MEALRLILRKDAEAGEGAEDAVERPGMRPHGLRQFLAVFRPVPEEIGNAELGHHIEQLRDLGPMDQVQQRHGGRVRPSDLLWSSG
jgi:hypothetical protein